MGRTATYKRDSREDNEQNKIRSTKQKANAQMFTMHKDEPEITGLELISHKGLRAKRTRNF